MKVLFVAARYAPHATGGAERVTRTLAEDLTSRGVEVTVVTTRQEGDPEERVVSGVRVRAIPLHNVYDFSAPAPPALKPLWHAADSYNPAMGASLGRLIRQEQPDLVHTHIVTGFSPSSWPAAHRLAVPCIHTLHDYYMVCARSTLAVNGQACESRHLVCRLLSRPRMRAAQSLSHVVGVSDYVLNRHRSYGALGEVPSSVIPNPCHLVGSAARTPAGPAGPLRFGYLGRIERNKGIHELIDAFSNIEPGRAVLHVGGTGESLPERPGIRPFGRVDPAAFLSDVDVLVVPSLVPETFGMSAAEALALGIPVIASTRGALPEMVKDGRNGWTFDPAAPDALVEAMHRALAHRQLPEMAAECQRSVERLRPDTVAASYIDLYNETISRHRSAER